MWLEWSEGQRLAKDEVGEASVGQITLGLRNHIRLYALYPRDDRVIRKCISLPELSQESATDWASYPRHLLSYTPVS